MKERAAHDVTGRTDLEPAFVDAKGVDLAHDATSSHLETTNFLRSCVPVSVTFRRTTSVGLLRVIIVVFSLPCRARPRPAAPYLAAWRFSLQETPCYQEASCGEIPLYLALPRPTLPFHASPGLTEPRRATP